MPSFLLLPLAPHHQQQHTPPSPGPLLKCPLLRVRPYGFSRRIIVYMLVCRITTCAMACIVHNDAGACALCLLVRSSAWQFEPIRLCFQARVSDESPLASYHQLDITSVVCLCSSNNIIITGTFFTPPVVLNSNIHSLASQCSCLSGVS